jgi:hypothetical protein
VTLTITGLQRAWRLVLLLLPTLWIAACASSVRDFPAWERVTRVRIIITTASTRGDLVKEIDDPAQVEKIVAFANGNLTGYAEPWFGEPLPPIEANFYDRRLYKGHFGVGANFFEIHRGQMTFMSKPASDQAVREFMELIGVDQSILDRRS